MNQKIYLDANLLIDIFDERDACLVELVEYSVKRKAFVYPFTATQISEITGPELDTRTKKRLEILSVISKDVYLCTATNTLEWRTEKPISVWDTINGYDHCGEPLELNAIVPHEKLIELRTELELDPNKLNNMTGREAVKEIDTALRNIKNKKYPNAPGSLQEMMDLYESIAPKLLEDVHNAAGIVDRKIDIKDRLLMAFSFLHTYGYWPDSKGVYKKGSGIPDGQHVVDAVHYDYLASRDQGMRNRAAAAYEILGLGTITIDLLELKGLLRES